MDEQTERMYELMRKECNRLKTFQMNPPWPKDYVDIKKLAKAGFFYAFNGDNVHCAFCRGQVCRWDRDDDPMAEHSRHFTTCPFVMGGEVGNEPLGEDPFPGPKRPRPYDVCGPFPSFPDDDPRSLECPTSLAESRPNNVNLNSPSHQPIDVFIDINNPRANIDNSQPQQQDQQRPHQHHHSQQQPQQQLQQQLQQLQHQQQELQQRQAQINRQPSPPPQESQSSYHNSLVGICKICYTNSIELVFLPCGHSVSCLSCAQSLYTCPYCRETITTRIRQYLV